MRRSATLTRSLNSHLSGIWVYDKLGQSHRDESIHTQRNAISPNQSRSTLKVFAEKHLDSHQSSTDIQLNIPSLVTLGKLSRNNDGV